MSALTDFITWLSSIRGDAADGIILVYHEPRKVIPAMLIESLKKYNLLERFKQIVKGFANGFNIAEVKCANTVRAYTLRTLSQSLFNQVSKIFLKYYASYTFYILNNKKVFLYIIILI